MHLKKFVKDVWLVGFINLVVAIKGLIVLSLLTKTLGPKDYGVFAQILVTMTLLSSVVTLSLPFSLVRFLAAENDKEKVRNTVYPIFILLLAIGLAIALFLMLFSGLIAGFFGADKPVLIQILSFIIILESLNLVFTNTFRAFQEIKKFAVFMILQILGELGMIILAISGNMGIVGATFALLFSRLIVFFLMGGIFIKKFGIAMPKFDRLREHVLFALPTLPASLFSYVAQQGDRYLIGYFLGAIFVGYYVPAYTLSSIIPLFLMTPMGFVLPAVLSKLYDEDKTDEVKFYLRNSFKYFLMAGVPMATGLMILSKQILTILTTQEIARNAYQITPLIVLGILLFGLYAIVVNVLILVKKTALIGKIWIATALLSFLLNIALVQRLGILGIAIGALFSYTLSLALTWYYAFKYIRFDIDWKFIIKSFIASAVMSSLILWLNPQKLPNLLATVGAGAIIYIISLFLLKGLTKREIIFFAGILKGEKPAIIQSRKTS